MIYLFSDWGVQVYWLKDKGDVSCLIVWDYDVLIVDYYLNFGEIGFEVVEMLECFNIIFLFKLLIMVNRSIEI